MDVITTALAVSALSAISGMLIGAPRQAKLAGFFAGLILGPLGALVAFRFDNRYRCPKCMGRHDDGAKICPNCGSDMRTVIPPMGT